MNFSTLAQIKTRLNNECDLFDEGFIEQDTELLGYINAAIDSAEAIIHKLYEDYFLDKATLTLVSGTPTISAPSDIFANKIRMLGYNNSSSQKVYEIKRILRPALALSMTYYTGQPYQYILTNDATAGIKINLYPTPQESGALIDCWYIRNAKTLSSSADQCDIPEFIEFIYSHVKWSVARKEKSAFDLETARTEYEVQKKLMEDTLSDMVPDESSDLIEKDFSFFSDFDPIRNFDY